MSALSASGWGEAMALLAQVEWAQPWAALLISLALLMPLLPPYRSRRAALQ